MVTGDVALLSPPLPSSLVLSFRFYKSHSLKLIKQVKEKVGGSIDCIWGTCSTSGIHCKHKFSIFMDKENSEIVEFIKVKWQTQ